MSHDANASRQKLCRKYRALGLCACGRKPISGRKQCAKCTGQKYWAGRRYLESLKHL